MLQRVDVESRTACALLVAMDEHEITMGEFTDAVELLTPEALQVLATALRDCPVIDPIRRKEARQARMICSRLASATRVLS